MSAVDEVRRCFEKARTAVGKDTSLTDDEIRVLTEVAIMKFKLSTSVRITSVGTGESKREAGQSLFEGITLSKQGEQGESGEKSTIPRSPEIFVSKDASGNISGAMMCSGDDFIHEFDMVRREPIGSAQAILAAAREAERITSTALWAVRKVVRSMAVEHLFHPVGCQRQRSIDIQTISQRVEKVSRFKVSRKLIHKAISLEKATEIPDVF